MMMKLSTQMSTDVGDSQTENSPEPKSSSGLKKQMVSSPSCAKNICEKFTSSPAPTIQLPNLNSYSSSLDDIEQNCAHIQPNELIIDQNQAIAIEVPPNTLKIDLSPFKPASEVHPEPGDIIEFDRTLFSQWGIYVGDGDVVVVVGHHLQLVPDSEIANVERAPLAVVAGDHFCRINNKLHRAKERNLLPFHNEIVVRKALSKVAKTVPYNALQCNTEHYVTEWKYGQRWSDQAQVSLHSFKALRLQHTNSISESHNVFVNTVNEVLNSPAVSHSSTGSQVASPTSMMSNSPPIQIQNRIDRSISISGSSGASSGSPPNLPSTHSMSSSFNTAGCQTELSFF